jgi:hypothetical protein
MTEDTPRNYTADDVNRIIRRALKIEKTEAISHQELLETARELGIDPGRIEDAVKLEASALEKERLKNEYLNRKRSRFKARLWTFVTLNGVVFILNAVTPGPWWFQWVLLGTGISLAIGFRKTYFPTEHQVERAMFRREILRSRHVPGGRHHP